MKNGVTMMMVNYTKNFNGKNSNLIFEWTSSFAGGS
jgi:hypothetical protein